MPTGEAAAWQELAAAAPRIAGLGMARLQAVKVALLGTLRRDGSPRISPVEPCLRGGELLIGAMAWSSKVSDLRRDPRYVLHSAITDPDSGEGELKLYGSAAEAAAEMRSAASGAWWDDWPPEKAVVFCLRVAKASYVSWDLEHGQMIVDRWSPRAGYSRASRSYP